MVACVQIVVEYVLVSDYALCVFVCAHTNTCAFVSCVCEKERAHAHARAHMFGNLAATDVLVLHELLCVSALLERGLGEEFRKAR